jgi:hypothetical protein
VPLGRGGPSGTAAAAAAPAGPGEDARGASHGGDACEAGGSGVGAEGGQQPSPPQRGPRRFMPFSEGLKNCLGQALGLMEVRTVLVSLLSRFWFELAPSMGKPEAVRRNQAIALTLKIKGGLQLVCHPHGSGKPGAAGAAKQVAAARGGGGARVN